MGPTVGLYIGSGLPPNLVRLLGSLAELVDEEFELEVIGRNWDPDQLPGRYSAVRLPGAEAQRGIDNIRRAYSDLRSYLSDEQPDALWQITSPHFHAVPAILAGRRADVPVATRIPGQKFDEFRTAETLPTRAKLFVLNNGLLRLIRFSSAVVVLSENNRKNVIARGVPPERVFLLPRALDTTLFAPVDAAERRTHRLDLGIPTNQTVVLFVGRLTRMKGMGTMASVARSVEDSDIQFHLVGEGPYAERLAGWSNVTLHGFVDPATVHRYYKAADLLFHPSYSEEAGISWTMIEAAAVGLPVLARDVGDANEVASATFETDAQAADLLSDTNRLGPGVVPERLSVTNLRPEYNRFLERLVSS